MTKGKSFVGTLSRMAWLADWPIRFVLARLRFSLRIACTHTHSQTQQRQTSSRVVCRIQSLCNIVYLEFYKLYVNHNHPYACITVNKGSLHIKQSIKDLVSIPGVYQKILFYRWVNVSRKSTQVDYWLPAFYRHSDTLHMKLFMYCNVSECLV